MLAYSTRTCMWGTWFPFPTSLDSLTCSLLLGERQASLTAPPAANGWLPVIVAFALGCVPTCCICPVICSTSPWDFPSVCRSLWAMRLRSTQKSCKKSMRRGATLKRKFLQSPTSWQCHQAGSVSDLVWMWGCELQGTWRAGVTGLCRFLVLFKSCQSHKGSRAARNLCDLCLGLLCMQATTYAGSGCQGPDAGGADAALK